MIGRMLESSVIDSRTVALLERKHGIEDATGGERDGECAGAVLITPPSSQHSRLASNRYHDPSSSSPNAGPLIVRVQNGKQDTEAQAGIGTNKD